MNLREGIDKLYAKQCLIRTLLEITRIPSPSTLEQGMIAYASQVLSENGFYVSVDSNGNIMARRGYADTFPLLNAHMDTTIRDSGATQRLVSPYYEIQNDLYARVNAYKAPWLEILKVRKFTKKEEAETRKVLKGFDKEHQDTVVKPLDKMPRQHQYTLIFPPDSWKPDHIQYDPQSDTISSRRSPQQIGGDDKAGIGIILCLALLTDLEFKVLLTVGEEPPFAGVYGVKTIPPQFFDDVSYCLTLDKRGKNSIVTKISGTAICSKQFEKIVKHNAKLAGVKFINEYGMMADAEIIAKYCQTVNLSAGYYNPHSREDYIVVGETLDMMRVVATCIENIGLTKKYRDRYN